jgi:uracil-DNA glycosylase family 4
MPYRIVSPTGPPRCNALAIGEAPGENEDRFGKAFIGKAGMLLDDYLEMAGLWRHSIRVTNIYPHWPGPGDPDPTPEQIASEIHLLKAEFETCQPKWVLLLGLVATRFFFGPKATIEALHGQPEFPSQDRWKELGFPGNGPPMMMAAYHPAAALRDPLMSARCLWDLQQFAKLAKGTWKADWAANTASVRKVLLTRAEVKETFIDRPCAIDTEGTVEKPKMMSVYWGGDVAYVILAEDARYLRFGPDAYAKYHYALYDLSVLKAMGVKPPAKFTDTAIKTFAGTFDPQGLKPLAWRRFRMPMRSYDDVVRPHFNKVAKKWLERAAAIDWPVPKARFIEDNNGVEKLYKPNGFQKRAKAMLGTLAKGEPGTKLEKLWAEVDEPSSYKDERAKVDFKSPAEAKLGPFPPFSIEHVPLKEAVDYAGDDAVATFRLDAVLEERLDRGLRPVVEQDVAYLPLVQRMQEMGLPVNMARARAFSEELGQIVADRRAFIRRVTDKRVLNPGSNQQVAAWLFAADGGRQKATRMTAGETRPTTDDRTLSILMHRDGTPPFIKRFCEALTDYREAEKYKGTYVDPLFGRVPHDCWYSGVHVEECQRLHVPLRTTKVATGRLSAGDEEGVPGLTGSVNALAMPTRTDLGKRVRGLYEAPDGRMLLSADASQLEVRLTADLSNDPELCRIYREQRDVYVETSIKLFGSEAERQIAKVLTLAILYGMMGKSYHERLQAAGVFKFSREDCDQHIVEWFKLYKGVKVFMDTCATAARKYGYVATRAGRRRYLPNCRLTNRELFYVRAEAERQAGNTPVQGGAADYIKRAGIRIWNWIGTLKPGTVEPLLQVHDEYILEVPEKNAKKYGAIVKRLMGSESEHEWEYRVPIQAKFAVAKTWAELKG